MYGSVLGVFGHMFALPLTRATARNGIGPSSHRQSGASREDGRPCQPYDMCSLPRRGGSGGGGAVMMGWERNGSNPTLWLQAAPYMPLMTWPTGILPQHECQGPA